MSDQPACPLETASSEPGLADDDALALAVRVTQRLRDSQRLRQPADAFPEAIAG